MDSRNIFRRFFGFPNKPPASFGLNDEETVGDERMKFFFDGNRSSKGLEDMFEHFHDDMWRQMETLHSQMEDLFHGFGAVDFPSSLDQPNWSPLGPGEHGKGNHGDKMVIWSNVPNPFFHHHHGKKNLRDFMLKDGADDDFRPTKPSRVTTDERSKFDSVFQPLDKSAAGFTNKRDTDLDGKISEEKMLEIIKQPVHKSPTIVKPDKHFLSRSVSVSTFRGPDNKFEQTRTVKDSSGNQETTVTRSLGDKSYTVTTVTGQDGTQQKHQIFNNMDGSTLTKLIDHYF